MCRVLGGLAMATLSLVLAGATAAQNVCDGVSPVENTTVQGVAVVTGVNRPLQVTAPPGDTDRIFVVEQDGVVRVKHRGTPRNEHSVFLDISADVNSAGNEQGLLSMAFDPDYESNGFFYVYYIRVGSTTSFVSRFSRDASDPDRGDPSSENLLMSILQPQSNHNGGFLTFGGDGYLYIGTGDGGGQGDNHGSCGNGQNTGTLLGKILRIDPNSTTSTSPDCGSGPYTIPEDNPRIDGAGGDCDEIFSWGLRNPWRYDIDPATGDIYIADVGQDCWEEINYTDAFASNGANYGWRQMEADQCFDPLERTNCSAAPVTCSGSPACNAPSLIIPVHQLSQTTGVCSITGGHVYRGCRMPRFDGTYFYGDYCDGQVRSLVVQDGVATDLRNWNIGSSLNFGLTSFGKDARGEIYVCDRSNGGANSGEILKLLPPFNELEVSGRGVLSADQFRLNRTGGWTWEDLEFNTMHPVDYYSVYRGQPGGAFECIHSTLSTEWLPDGDPTIPAPGDLQAYLVTATSGADETSSGVPPRSLVTPCTPP